MLSEIGSALIKFLSPIVSSKVADEKTTRAGVQRDQTGMGKIEVSDSSASSLELVSEKGDQEPPPDRRPQLKLVPSDAGEDDAEKKRSAHEATLQGSGLEASAFVELISKLQGNKENSRQSRGAKVYQQASQRGEKAEIFKKGSMLDEEIE